MTRPKDTRAVTRELREAGFLPGHKSGSHTKWRHPSGISIPVPDGHNMISAGVYGQILKKIQEAQDRENQEDQ